MNHADYLEALESIAERGHHRDANDIFDAAGRTIDAPTTPLRPGAAGPHRRRLLATALAAALLIGGVSLVIRHRASDDALTTTTSPAAPSTPPLSGGPTLAIPAAALDARVAVPTGWQTIDYGLGRIAAPADWGPLLNDSPRCGTFDFKTVVLLGSADPAPTTSTCDAQPPSIRLQSTVAPCLGCTPLAPVNGLPVQQLPTGKCALLTPTIVKPCSLSYYFADLRLEIDMGVDADTAQQILSTVTLSPQARVLADGPVVDTSTWQTVTEGPITVRVPAAWNHRELGPADSTPHCGGNPLASHENTVLTGWGGLPSSCPPRQGPWPAHPADGIWISTHPAPTADTTGAGYITLPNGAIQIDQADASDHIYIQVPSGAQQTTVAIGIGADPAIARTVIRNLVLGGQPLAPATSPTAETSTATSTTGSVPQPDGDPACNDHGLPYAQEYGTVTGVIWTGPLTVTDLVKWFNRREQVNGTTPPMLFDPTAVKSSLGLTADAVVHVCIYSGNFDKYSPPVPTPHPTATEIGVLVLPDGAPRLDYARDPSAAPVNHP